MNWYCANKQQSGRGSIGKSQLFDLPFLNVTTRSEKQVKFSEEIFDEIASARLLTLHQLTITGKASFVGESILRLILLTPTKISLSGTFVHKNLKNPLNWRLDGLLSALQIIPSNDDFRMSIQFVWLYEQLKKVVIEKN